MKLTKPQRDALDGKHGWPRQIAMRILVAVGQAHDAENLIPIGSVHLGLSGASMGEPGMHFLEKLAERGAEFVVPTTLNILSVERRVAGTVPALQHLDQIQLSIAQACEAMGGRPTYSCNPFLLGVVPARDESVAWNESATAPYVNSILGARTNREGATALASAITGLTANYGMHLPRNRLGSVLIEVDAPVSGADDFNLLGGAVARMSGTHIPVIEGIQRTPSLDEMTAFSAAFAAVSPAAMVHIVGVTPEAPTRGAAVTSDAPEDSLRIDAEELARERARYQTAITDAVDVVVVGCPHASLEQVREVAEELGNQRVHDRIRFIVQVSRDCANRVNESALGPRLAKAGVSLQSDSCVHVAYDALPVGCTLATNSLKIAYLIASHDVNVRFGTLSECVRAGMAGRWIN